jgi:ecotin
MKITKSTSWILRFFFCLTIIISLSQSNIAVAAEDRIKPAGEDRADSLYLKHFPEKQPEQERVVILLPKRDNGQDLKVELIFGVIVQTDLYNPNRFWIEGTLTEKTVKGWGLRYYVLNADKKRLSSTRALSLKKMAGKDKDVFAPVVNRSDSNDLLSRDLLLHYNSKEPIVVYVPSGFEVRYRLWTTDDNIVKAKPE